jgi:hypothetical protein
MNPQLERITAAALQFSRKLEACATLLVTWVLGSWVLTMKAPVSVCREVSSRYHFWE